MSDDKKKFQEFFVIPSFSSKVGDSHYGVLEITEKKPIPDPNGIMNHCAIHCIEYAAYEKEKQKAQKLVEALENIVRSGNFIHNDKSIESAEILIEEYEAENE